VEAYRIDGARSLCLTRFLYANRLPLRLKTLSLFDAFSLREPASTSLENAMIDTSSMPADHAAGLSLVAAPIRLTSRQMRKSTFNSGLQVPFWS
jgi:hypothetical protein